MKAASGNEGEVLSIREQLKLDYGTDSVLFRDPAFMENREVPVHRWVPWIAGFSASFVEDCFKAFLPGRRECLVLDPFAGVGTTLIAALRSGHHTAGFEINPYAALACRAKVEGTETGCSGVGAYDRSLLRSKPEWQPNGDRR